ncbi:hypothetical protein [Stenotrophomonas sp. PS02301]|uniref:hypothetical protein n=1 Tax=Stenotrophomonas sp. PS02301 TaxID=2991427 RepID=UPI00249C2D00|nr:hypothetical protein [Stenotrophomonas sp. PS02301]
MKYLSPLLLITCLAAASAQAAEPTVPGDCITLSADQQLVRNRADRDVLLRNGAQHYLVRFERSCSSAAMSPKLAFVTPGREGQLCGAGASNLRTNAQSCAISAVDPITAEEFTRKARARQ